MSIFKGAISRCPNCQKCWLIGDEEQRDVVSVLLDSYQRCTAIRQRSGRDQEAKGKMSFAAVLREKSNEHCTTRLPIPDEKANR